VDDEELTTMTTETRGITLAWIGVGMMLLAGVMYLWKLL
jgi:hypothetical protein